MKKKLLWCMTALTALLSASCSSELALEGGNPNNVATGEEVDVTFSISAESAQMQTRVGDPGQYQTKVGRGTEIDMLIYAVYEEGKDEDKNDVYTLLKQYGSTEIPTELENSNAINMKYKRTKEDGTEEEYTPNREGQTILYVGDVFKEENGVKEIKLRLMRGKTYHIAFWAQSSKTEAFKTNDLENVEVIYENAKNNDELRDAFCKVERFSVSPSTAPRTVILTRPMAQINVGTTGADYKHLLANNVYPNKPYTKSKIILGGVAKTINVVSDEIGPGTETAKFGWSPLAAYIKNDGRIPDIIAPLIYLGENAAPYYDYSQLIQCENEEFLIVDLDYDGKIIMVDIDYDGHIIENDIEQGYKTEYPTIKVTRDENGNITETKFLTETFKYLSMCYALVPASHTAESGDAGSTTADNDEDPYGDGDESDDDYEFKDPYKSSVLNKVEVFFAEEDVTDEDNIPATIALDFVPVHRNWRTNILGGLYDPTDPNNPDDPDDPNDPNDPTSVFNFTKIRMVLDNFFHGEYNGTIGDYNKDDGSYKWKDLPNEDEEEGENSTPNGGDDQKGQGDDSDDEKTDPEDTTD